MKKILLLTVFLTLLSGSIKPEDKVFPESDAIWNVHVRDYAFHQYVYGLSGDTIINNKKYSKLYLLNDTILPAAPDDYYLGGLREENKQVWFLIHNHKSPHSEISEYILYDFSKEEGDTFIRNNVLYLYGNSFLYVAGIMDEMSTTVNKVEYTSLGRQMHVDHPTWFFQPNEIIWVEGIGSLNGILWDYWSFPMSVSDVETKLACFKQGDEVIYNNNEYGSCFCDTPDVSIDSPSAPSVLVYTDAPSQSLVVISGKLPLRMEIIGLDGKCVREETISRHPHIVSYRDLNYGLYLYRLWDDNRIVQTGKVMLR
ncbi:MAG: hypothetical protein LIO93_05650 [Bacteroidales bacterium]|nr:hypothetical protein [Bacteroidales bacterium]